MDINVTESGAEIALMLADKFFSDAQSDRPWKEGERVFEDFGSGIMRMAMLMAGEDIATAWYERDNDGKLAAAASNPIPFDLRVIPDIIEAAGGLLTECAYTFCGHIADDPFSRNTKVLGAIGHVLREYRRQEEREAREADRGRVTIQDLTARVRKLERLLEQNAPEIFDTRGG